MTDPRLPVHRRRGTHRRHAAVSAIAMLIAYSSAGAAEVSFREAFEAASSQDVATITIPDSDVLVFDGRPYYTMGRRLVVVASKARVDGEVRLGFFPPDSRPPAKSGTAATGTGGPAGGSCGGNGCIGKDGQIGVSGASGDTGAPATSILFDVRELQGDGRLTLVAAGQSGGKGQQGGQGGTGGRGGDGAKRSCGGALGLDTRAGPGDGGTGGNGGPGGTGGPGGQGGAGGTITLSADLTTALQAGRIVADLRPAAGGEGGDPGAKGQAGGGGGMGGGNSCGGGGSSGKGGAEGGPGSRGEQGPWGTQASLRYWSGNEAAANGATTKLVRRRLSQSVAGMSRNCPDEAHLVFLVTPPEGQAIAQIDPPQIVRLVGAQGIVMPPVVSRQRTIEGPDRVEIRAAFQRHRIPRPYLANPPNLKFEFTCPDLEVELEVPYSVTPINAPLGAKLSSP